ncbi:MAG: polysaccharide biosynthesis protein [Anaerolineaceae bacterium]|nr:polysaccharide biosynthesis protein [Anaerolineaceae bacterium]
MKRIFTKKSKSPYIRNRYVLIADLALIVIAGIGSYALRLELGTGFFFYLPSAYWMIGAGLIVKPIFYYYFGLYRRLWAYASIREMKVIAIAVSSASVLVSLIMILALVSKAFTGFPRSVLVIDWMLSLLSVGGVRFAVRLLSEENTRTENIIKETKSRRALIVGAGDAGALVVRELEKNPQLKIKPVGFLDDDPSKQNQQIYGISVVGKVQDLTLAIDKYHAAEVIIAVPSAPGQIVRKIAEICQLKGTPFRTMPGLYELIGGAVSVNRLRDVEIADLLRREQTKLHEELIGDTISGKTVLVSGGGGSIGRELCRQIARWGPSELILMGHGENSIFEGYLELERSFPHLKIIPIIADMRDRDRLEVVFNRYLPQVIFHAAAHKHVPLMEINVEDAITNNILGTQNIVEVALTFDVEKLVMISTDKAIRPANIMGATKRIAEMIVLDAARRSDRAFSIVRFGNVLGSRGSVVPLFKDQIARGGPVTVNHPEMRRYFMTIPEAVYLVLQAASLGEGKETFILNMGEQVKIYDLAKDLILLSGLEPYKDIEIIFTGVRPGDKLSEDLWEDGHEFEPTEHPEIFQHNGQDELEGDELQNAIVELVNFSREGAVQEISLLLLKLIPGASMKTLDPRDISSIF